jgi:4a-hydroxytetrahydrobiopterin dehydratase
MERLVAVAKLTETELSDLLARHPEWSLRGDGIALERTFRFADFNAAFGFMTRVALYADKADHHPEWFNVYNRVEMTLTTHDAAGISTRDAAMVEWIKGIER